MMIFVIGQAPFDGWRHHLSPSSKGHYGCWAAASYGFLLPQAAPAAKRQSTTLSGQRPLSNLRTLRTFGAKGSVNPHAKGVSKGDTTTLSRKAAVKLQNLKNLRGGAPSTFYCKPGPQRGLYHSSSPQGSSEILSRRMYTFSVSYSICSDQRVTARMRSWVRAHSRRMKVTLSRL